MTARSHAPIEESERAEILDALRAFALLGIFISHVPDFSGFTFMTEAERAAHDAIGANATIAALMDFLIRGKFVALFSFLFGIGFAVQLDSAVRRGAHFASHFARRLSILFLIGALHAVIWYGDILKDYALIGLLLILTARWSASATLNAAIAVLAVRVLWPFVILIVAGLAQLEASANPTGSFSGLALTASDANVTGAFAANLELLRYKAMQMIYDGKAIAILSMFLLGAYVGKRRLYRDLSSNAALPRRVLAICLPFGLAGNALLVPLDAVTPDYPPSFLRAIEQALFALAVPAMTLAYASAFALLWLRPARASLAALAPAGRMALTTYVSQTLVGVVVFYAIGFGLRGTIGLAECVVFAVAVFALQCALSAAWLSVFRFGPLEWIWRRATYGVPLPMLRRAAALA